MSITLTKETSLFKKDVIKDGISGAAATATDYIDDVPNSSQTGMTLQPVSNNANNYIQLDSDGLAVYKAGQLIASYGQSILLYHPGVSPLNAAVEITNSSARFTGQIQADSGYIGGWSIGADANQSLHNGAANVSPAPGVGKIILSTGISGSNVQNGLLPPNKTWAFTAGNQFGVTTDGELYASGAHLEDLLVGNYSDATTNHLYGNCVWTPPFAAYFNTDLGNTRRTYQGWTIEQNTGEYFDFDTTNNWLVVDYSNYADKTTTKVLQQNTGIVAPNTNFTISADLGTDCKVVFGGIEISGTDWQTADDGRKYATFTTTANTTSGVFEIWPVASENYIFKGNKFKLEKSDSYSSWTTLDEQIGKTGNAISQSAEATASYFLNFTSADGLKISNNADPSTTTTDYIQITSSGVKTVYDSTHFSNLTSEGLRIYSGDSTYPVASFITDTTNNNVSSVNFYKNGTDIPLVTINQNGATFNGDGTIGASGGIKLSTTNFTYSGSIGGSASGLTNWRFTIGNKFGVTSDGTLYANQASLSGAISATNGLVISQNGNTIANFDSNGISFDPDINFTLGNASNFISWTNGALSINTNSLNIGGEPLQTYYTYVRYATDSSGSGMTDTPTSATKYIGVYTGTSDTVPSASDSGWHWSLYAGSDGRGISSTEVRYQSGSNGTSAPTGTWLTYIPSISQGYYLWTRTRVQYTDGSYSDPSYSVARQAYDGSPGTDTAWQYMNFISGSGSDAGLYIYSSTSGKNSSATTYQNYTRIRSDSIDLVAQGVTLAHFGYENTNTSDDTSTSTGNRPFYNLGVRNASATKGGYSVVEGYNSEASGYCSHAEGRSTTASKYGSHAEGCFTTASGYGSHAEGYNTTASGNYSHAEGYYTIASGKGSHAEGSGHKYTSGQAISAYEVKASGDYSHASGYATNAGYSYQTVIGKFNENKSTSLFEIGRGSSNTSRSNAFEVANTGEVTINADDYANDHARLKISITGTDWLSLAVGQGGDNHGVYSHASGKWLIMGKNTDNSRVFVGGSSGSRFCPQTNDNMHLGDSTYRWQDIYAKNTSIQTSDKKEKDILGTIDFANKLIMALKPTQYMWKDGNHRRARMGFIAQDVAQVCNDMGLNLSLYTASYRNKKDDSYYGEEVDDELLTWGLSYGELIAPMVQVIQNQQKEIDQLKKEVAKLKEVN